jgi:hypothetical protein
MLIQLSFVQGREMYPVHELLEPTDFGQGVLSAPNGARPIADLALCFDLVERPQITRHHPLHEHSEEGWRIEDADLPSPSARSRKSSITASSVL